MQAMRPLDSQTDVSGPFMGADRGRRSTTTHMFVQLRRLRAVAAPGPMLALCGERALPYERVREGGGGRLPAGLWPLVAKSD
jgi:hypothetical protein